MEPLCRPLSFWGEMVGGKLVYDVCCFLFWCLVFWFGGFWRLLLWPCRGGLSNRAARMVRGLDPDFGYKAGLR